MREEGLDVNFDFLLILVTNNLDKLDVILLFARILGLDFQELLKMFIDFILFFNRFLFEEGPSGTLSLEFSQLLFVLLSLWLTLGSFQLGLDLSNLDVSGLK